MLKLIPEIDSLFICKRGSVDSWGISSVSEEMVEIKGRIKGSESATPVESLGGKQVIPTYDISINGDCEIAVGDMVVIDGVEFRVLTKQPKKDLSGKIIFYKYKV